MQQSFYSSRCVLFLSILSVWLSFAGQTDLIIFSYNRPLQLYGLLESIERHMEGLNAIQVVYRCSDELYAQAYDEVWQSFPQVITYQQGEHPESDFKALTMQALLEGGAPYVLFAVDDMIVKEAIDCNECIDLLEHYNAHGFYLRLGKNLNYCYSLRRTQPLPYFEVDDAVCVWQFGYGMYDWNYPYTVDMTLYRKYMVINDFSTFAFRHPTDLEGTWSTSGWRLADHYGICYAQTKVVNIPLNLVQQVMANNHMNFMSCQQLLELFMEHKKIDIDPLYGYVNRSAHMEYVPTFIDRS